MYLENGLSIFPKLTSAQAWYFPLHNIITGRIKQGKTQENIKLYQTFFLPTLCCVYILFQINMSRAIYNLLVSRHLSQLCSKYQNRTYSIQRQLKYKIHGISKFSTSAIQQQMSPVTVFTEEEEMMKETGR